jgi:glycosyltransferase involved in cell wall biosynthesis
MSNRARDVLVIIPTHNRAEFISHAIQSSLDQNYPAVKTLIIDDGSTDDTREVCFAFQKERPDQFDYVRQENRGCASARNRGLGRLDDRFGFICFLDSDDRLLPGKLAREVQLLDEHPEADFTYADSVVFDELTGLEQTQEVAAAGRPDCFAIEHFLTSEAKCSAILYRAAAVRNKRFREDLMYNEDSEFLQRVSIEHRCVYSPHPGCWVRWHAGSKSRNFLEIQKAVLRASLDILRTYPEFYATFRVQVDRRIREIETSLFRQFMLIEQWDQASLYATTLLDRFFLALRSNSYYRLRHQAGQVLMKLR